MSGYISISELKEMFQELKLEFQQARRPADEILLDDVDLRQLLKVSKRTTATWRKNRWITYYRMEGKIYYKLSDILSALESHKVSALKEQLNIKL